MRFTSPLFALVALTVLWPAHAATHKKVRHHQSRHEENAGGPFADVPRGHWAYDAVQKAAEAGIVQGWNNRFHGKKVVNRYQMAVIVARMLDRVGVLRANGKVITAQDIANLESLVIEFADELALLNVKVSTLEDTVAGLKKDVDLIKADLRGVGARAGISGTVDTRFVFTGDSAPNYRYGGIVGAGPFTATPNPAATAGLTRYRGQTVSGGGAAVTNPAQVGISGPFQFDSRQFFTVANFALSIDREFDPHTHFHAQLNINAEGSLDATADGGGPLEAFPRMGAPVVGFPSAGRGNNFASIAAVGANLLVNELYVVFDDWFSDGVSGRLGIYALPMNTEVNGPDRTYLWTLTPSIANSRWESIRPIGLDIFQHNDRDSLVFYAGFFTPGEASFNYNRSGTLLSDATLPGNLNQVDPLPNPNTAATPPFTGGRFPTPMAAAAMTDAARGVDGQILAGDSLGFYALIGSHPTCKDHRGLSWHVAYYDRNGDRRPGLDEEGSQTDWNAWQVFLGYQWSDVLLMAQYYHAETKNLSFADLGFAGAPALDARHDNLTTPFTTLEGFDTISHSFMALLNWQFTRRGNVTVRYEEAADRTGVAALEAEVWTSAFNWRAGDHSWLQLEWIAPRSTSVSENGVHNVRDINDDLVQANYKFHW